MVTLLPRLVVAAPTSGTGKTTIATGLLRALRDAGIECSGHKVGPDYIDPSWHALACGRPGRNLDPHLTSEEVIAPLLLHGARDVDVAIIEGVMGLFDGALATDGFGSTAHIARLTDSPIVLVVDASRTSRSIAALVHGFLTFEPDLRFAGVIVNKVGSARHEAEVVRSLEAVGTDVLGVIPRSTSAELGSRHLGLITAAEHDAAESTVQAFGELVAEHIDLTAVMKAAHDTSPLTCDAWNPTPARLQSDGLTVTPDGPHIGLFTGDAFTFHYTENREMLEAAGARITEINPATDAQLPSDVTGLLLGGGFPELHLDDLCANHALLSDVRARAGDGMPIIAECGGLTYLCDTLDGRKLTGVIPAEASMTGKLTLGYRHATSLHDTPLTTRGRRVTGHEFHRTTVHPKDGSTLPGLEAAWGMQVDSAAVTEGFASANLLASYLHQHWAASEHLPQAFLEACGPSHTN